MCGISGVFNYKNSRTVNEDGLTAMRDSLIHRGPDSEGSYASPDGRVGLGFRRLAIIDLSPAGNQPMTNEDGTVWIVFNGEIYNFQEIKTGLLKRGHRFNSKSDTEVIIHAYEEYGTGCVKRFNGMFAFVIWDEKNKILFGARDQVGIKPFYYGSQDGTFYFGSEVKSILSHPDFRKGIDEDKISLYLTFASLPAPYTLFKDIKKLPAGHILMLREGGEIKTQEYWSPLDAKTENLSEEDYVAKTREILEDSIKLQMVSDVPFGCFLSGGIDSSTNAALMTKALGTAVETFSIGVEDYQKYNEFQYSRQVAELLGAKKHEIIVGRKNLLEFMPEYPKYADDPNGDQICFLVFYLSRLIRQSGVIVAQVGEGSDEIFAGYGTYLKSVNLYEKHWRFLKALPDFARKLPFSFTGLFLTTPKYDFLNTYLERLKNNDEPFWGNAIAFSHYQKEKLLTENYKKKLPENSGYEVIKNIYKEIDDRDPRADFLKRMTYLELKIRLPELLLARVDKMAMANSIETRVPFLDTRLVELAFSMPEKLKLKDQTTKYVLKKAVSGIILDEIIWRKKQGFGAPVAEWLRNKETAKDLTGIIFNSGLKERGILNYDYVKNLIASHQSGKADHNFRIWNLITLSLWHDYWSS